MNKRFCRRTLLSGLGLSAAMLPLLESEVRSQTAPKPKRLIICALPNGVKEEVYWPQGTVDDWTIPTDAEVPAAHKYSPLAPLIPHKNDLIFIGGLVCQNGRDSNGGSLGGHGSLPFHLTGAHGVPGPTIGDGVTMSAGAPSIDQFIAKEIGKRVSLPFESLVLRAPPEVSYHNDKFISFYGPPIDLDTPNAPAGVEDPIQLYDDLFGSRNVDSDLTARLRFKQKSLLDLVGNQLERFAKNLGSEDRQRVEAHLTSVRAIEKQMEFFGSCTNPLAPTFAPDYMTTNGNPYVPELVKAQIDLTVAAMACDMTRVSTMLWHGRGNVRVVYHWLGPEFTEAGTDFANAGENQGLRNDHEIAHRDSEAEFQVMKNRVTQWWTEQYAYIIQKLKDAKDPDGTSLFDNSAVLFVHLQRTGGGHHTDNLPWLLAGSCGGYFKTGRNLAWPSGDPGTSVPQNGVLAALANAMDCPVDWYGSADYGGELSLLKG